MLRYLVLGLTISAVPLFAQSDQFLSVMEGKRFADPTVTYAQASKGPAAKELLLRTSDLYLPQVASSGTFESGFLTFLNFTNMTESEALFAVAFFDANGDPLSMPLVRANDDGSGCFACPPVYSDTLELALAPGASLQQAVLPDGLTRMGWAGVLSPGVAVGVTATFMQIVPDRPLFMAGIPPSTIQQDHAWLVQSDTGGFTTSLALANSDTEFTNVYTLTYRDSSGQEICNASFNLAPFGHRALLIRDVLPCAAGKEGVVEITGSGAFAGIGFWAHDSGGFVTQPLLEPHPDAQPPLL